MDSVRQELSDTLAEIEEELQTHIESLYERRYLPVLQRAVNCLQERIHRHKIVVQSTQMALYVKAITPEGCEVYLFGPASGVAPERFSERFPEIEEIVQGVLEYEGRFNLTINDICGQLPEVGVAR